MWNEIVTMNVTLTHHKTCQIVLWLLTVKRVCVYSLAFTTVKSVILWSKALLDGDMLSFFLYHFAFETWQSWWLESLNCDKFPNSVHRAPALSEAAVKGKYAFYFPSFFECNIVVTLSMSQNLRFDVYRDASGIRNPSIYQAQGQRVFSQPPFCVVCDCC